MVPASEVSFFFNHQLGVKYAHVKLPEIKTDDFPWSPELFVTFYCRLTAELSDHRNLSKYLRMFGSLMRRGSSSHTVRSPRMVLLSVGDYW